ncbi:MAG: radical SAM protein [Ktedonobacter sp. 13_1_20CM_3_54_15]|nr:MAG: radical SAM protein [Ktedonobacter sp. 13_2_20CM_53_11]OLE32225.1 MAG: radical SAM protein [Ktedonobacter sp. 13_1_20CM_3_54_15]
MRSPGDILLISCYELGHQPFHLASLCAMLQQAGYAPATVDTAVETLTEVAISRARLVAISVPMHTALRLGQQVALRVRSINPSASICFYGLYALLNADYLLLGTIDAAIGGEYEGPFLNYVAAVEQGKTESIAGVTTRQSKSGPWIKRTSFVAPVRLDLPSPDHYARLETNGVASLAGYTETTRGCKHTCLHCPITPIYHGRFFAVPVEIVLADIRTQVRQGVGHITFGDPDFFNGPGHAMRITRALHQEFPGITFDATIKIEHLLKHRHLLPELKSLGCAFIVSAVESLNDNVLRHLDKGHTSADVAEAIELMAQMGIPLRPSLMPFSPWETLESYFTLLNFFEERRLIEQIDPVHFSIRLLVPPGSTLLDTVDSPQWLGELDSAAFTYRWRHSDSRMDALYEKVAALVERAERAKASPIETFFHIKAMALAISGKDVDVVEAVQEYGSPRVLPHLTESWFC